MDSSASAVSAADDVTAIERTCAATAERDEPAARYVAAVADVRAAVLRAQAALAVAQVHLQRARNAQKQAHERISMLRRSDIASDTTTARPEPAGQPGE
jgi:hypothetical protein